MSIRERYPIRSTPNNLVYSFKSKGTKGKGQRRDWGYGQPWQTYDLQQYQNLREVQPAQAPAPTPGGQQSRKIQKQLK